MSGRVLVLVKVFPESVETNLEELKERIKNSMPEGCAVHKFEEEDIGFGIRALKVFIVMPEDYEGGTSAIEESIGNVEGVGQVQVDYVTRL
ncbi:MAG: elongation factor 1-beta [Thermoprotei archaeon]|nr:MAG: elongation factor 1-beta [Thermoprotei archaeon]